MSDPLRILVASTCRICEGEARAGRTNGLCGAAVAGCLFLCTGLSGGRVALTVEAHGTAPP
ncbi:hypothetical protein GTW46_04715, partial [Streptomyces sp. SID6013]|nr:hypothetical protein [Streptomyces sp. SID6013]